jgi:hypothetical protein
MHNAKPIHETSPIELIRNAALKCAALILNIQYGIDASDEHP